MLRPPEPIHHWRVEGMNVGKARKADSIFEPGLVLRHLYDFGTTSETDIKVIGFGKARRLANTRLRCWRATRCPQRYARNAANRRNGCVLNASTRKTKPATCAMSMSKNIRTRIMASRCRCSTRRGLGCAAMRGRPSHPIEGIMRKLKIDISISNWLLITAGRWSYITWIPKPVRF